MNLFWRKETVNQIWLKARNCEFVYNILFAVCIGILVGCGAIGFKLLIQGVERIFFGSYNPTLEIFQDLTWYDRLMIPVIGALIVGSLIHFLAKEARGHGVPEVMESIVVRQGKIHPKTVLTRSVASSLTIGSGGSVGPEGPIVQIGAAIGSTIGQIFRVPPFRMRTFVGCGTAAGIAAMFNAPIAGALFALEIVMKDFAISRFGPVIVSSVIGAYVSRLYWGNYPDFSLPVFSINSTWDLAFFSLLGIMAGLVSILYIKMIYAAEDLFAGFRFPHALKPVFGGIVVGVIALKFPHVYGIGHEVVLQAALSKIGWQMLVALIAMKLVATAMTIGSGNSGGVFTPAIFIGAVLGGALGQIVHTALPSLTADPGAYAVAGMGALVAGATHAPLTALILSMEICNSYSIIIPIMITCVVSLLISRTLHEESLYTLKLGQRGIDFFRQKRINVLKSRRVESLMKEEFELIVENTPLPALLNRITQSDQTDFFVVDSKQHFRGMISMADLRLMLVEQENLDYLVIAGDLADQNVPVLTPDDTLDMAMGIFGNINVDNLPVVDVADRTKIIGRVPKKDVIAIYNKEIFEDNIVEGMEGKLAELDRTQQVNLGDGFIMTETGVPINFIGKSIKELNIRSSYGIEILLIKRRAAEKDSLQNQIKSDSLIRFIPDSNYRIQSGDYFLVIGKTTDIENFKKRISSTNYRQ